MYNVSITPRTSVPSGSCRCSPCAAECRANSGAHQVAMRILARVGSDSSYARWQQETPDIPTWEEAHKPLLEKGKRSKLNNQTAFHVAGHTAHPPRR